MRDHEIDVVNAAFRRAVEKKNAGKYDVGKKGLEIAIAGFPAYTRIAAYNALGKLSAVQGDCERALAAFGATASFAWITEDAFDGMINEFGASACNLGCALVGAVMNSQATYRTDDLFCDYPKRQEDLERFWQEACGSFLTRGMTGSFSILYRSLLQPRVLAALQETGLFRVDFADRANFTTVGTMLGVFYLLEFRGKSGRAMSDPIADPSVLLDRIDQDFGMSTYVAAARSRYQNPVTAANDYLKQHR